MSQFRESIKYQAEMSVDKALLRFGNIWMWLAFVAHFPLVIWGWPYLGPIDGTGVFILLAEFALFAPGFLALIWLGFRRSRQSRG